jgi:hypothetical protein
MVSASTASTLIDAAMPRTDENSNSRAIIGFSLAKEGAESVGEPLGRRGFGDSPGSALPAGHCVQDSRPV